MKTLPYEGATTGKAAVEEMRRILLGFGASSFGVMEDFANGLVIVQFEHRGRHVIVKASVRGYAAAWLREHPWSRRHRGTEIEHQRQAVNLANVAVWSVLRDWIKVQVTAIEIGMLSFEGAFLGQILLPGGDTVLERITETKMLQLERGP